MTETYLFTVNSGLGNSCSIDFISAKKAQTFIDNYEYLGEIKQFNWDYVSSDKKTSVTNLKSSERLFDALMAVLLNKNQPITFGIIKGLGWVKYIFGRKKDNVLFMTNKKEYPTEQTFWRIER